MTETLNFAGQELKLLSYQTAQDLEQKDKATFDRILNEGFFGDAEAMKIYFGERRSGVVIYGDVTIPHNAEEKTGRFIDLYEALEPYEAEWIVFTGNVDAHNSVMVTDVDRVMMLGDLKAVGVSNICGLLFVAGKTEVSGGLIFDSSDGGFTSLDLVKPVGFVCTTANVFNIQLDTKYLIDSIFKLDGEGNPQNVHTEKMLSRFQSFDNTRLVTAEELADFFKPFGDDIAQEVRGGEYEALLDEFIIGYNSAKLVEYFEASLK